MGRRHRAPSSGTSLRSEVEERPRYEVTLAAEAEDDLTELITYIQQDSPKNASAVFRAISKRLHLLGATPEMGHADPTAFLVPLGASARLTNTRTIGIHYLFPMKRDDREIVYVLGVRRGLRMPLEQADYARRWVQEASRVPPAEGRPEQHD